MTKHNAAENKSKHKFEIITNLMWTIFGVITGLDYYSKEEYLICGVMSSIGILCAYKLIKSIISK